MWEMQLARMQPWMHGSDRCKLWLSSCAPQACVLFVTFDTLVAWLECVPWAAACPAARKLLKVLAGLFIGLTAAHLAPGPHLLLSSLQAAEPLSASGGW